MTIRDGVVRHQGRSVRLPKPTHRDRTYAVVQRPGGSLYCVPWPEWRWDWREELLARIEVPAAWRLEAEQRAQAVSP